MYHHNRYPEDRDNLPRAIREVESDRWPQVFHDRMMAAMALAHSITDPDDEEAHENLESIKALSARMIDLHDRVEKALAREGIQTPPP